MGVFTQPSTAYFPLMLIRRPLFTKGGGKAGCEIVDAMELPSSREKPASQASRICGSIEWLEDAGGLRSCARKISGGFKHVRYLSLKLIGYSIPRLANGNGPPYPRTSVNHQDQSPRT
jgi:hypothetical protein